MNTGTFLHAVVPIGGMVIGWIGWIDGGTMGQICGAQIAGMSNGLRHRFCKEPLTQRQTHCA